MWDRCYHCDAKIHVIDGKIQAYGWINSSYSCFCSIVCRIAYGMKHYGSAPPGPFCPECGQRFFNMAVCAECGTANPSES